MTTNPLKSDAPRPGKVTVEILEELAKDLNGEGWVKHMGRHYFVGSETIHAGGEKRVRRFLDWQRVVPSHLNTDT